MSRDVKGPHQGLPPPPGGSLLLGLPRLLILPLLRTSNLCPHPHHPTPPLHKKSHSQSRRRREQKHSTAKGGRKANYARFWREEPSTETTAPRAGMLHCRGGEDAGDPACDAERWRSHFSWEACFRQELPASSFSVIPPYRSQLAKGSATADWWELVCWNPETPDQGTGTLNWRRLSVSKTDNLNIISHLLNNSCSELLDKSAPSKCCQTLATQIQNVQHKILKTQLLLIQMKGQNCSQHRNT
jgi:hypothetical protein